MAIGIGLAGAGRRATEVYGPALAAYPEVRFAGVWSRSPAAARIVADRHGVRSYDRYGELLEQCDAVVFAVPAAAQVDLAATAARRGRAVLLERPIAADLAGAEELVAAVTAGKVASQLALSWRYTPAVREYLAAEVPRVTPAGGSGRVVRAAPPVAAAGDPVRQERRVLRAEGADLLDLLDAALGPVVHVRAHGDPHGWLGMLLDHEVGRFSEASLYTTAADGTNRADVEVFGPGGSAAIDCSAVVGPDTFLTMIQEFAQAVARRSAPELDVRHGLRLQRVIEDADTRLVVGG